MGTICILTHVFPSESATSSVPCELNCSRDLWERLFLQFREGFGMHCSARFLVCFKINIWCFISLPSDL